MFLANWNVWNPVNSEIHLIQVIKRKTPQITRNAKISEHVASMQSLYSQKRDAPVLFSSKGRTRPNPLVQTLMPVFILANRIQKAN